MKIIRIYMKSFDFYLLNKVVFDIKNISKKLNFSYKGPIFLPNKIEKYNILRSPHVNKKSRDQLQICWHKRFIELNNFDHKNLINIKNVFIYYNLSFFIKVFI